jgi:hypothetical protein
MVPTKYTGNFFSKNFFGLLGGHNISKMYSPQKARCFEKQNKMPIQVSILSFEMPSLLFSFCSCHLMNAQKMKIKYAR